MPEEYDDIPEREDPLRPNHVSQQVYKLSKNLEIHDTVSREEPDDRNTKGDINILPDYNSSPRKKD